MLRLIKKQRGRVFVILGRAMFIQRVFRNRSHNDNDNDNSNNGNSYQYDTRSVEIV